MRPDLPRRRLCAIYTRKSTDEGLEQSFNSLDAQREACAAYILSQNHEGWEARKELYDDGGYSGGSLDRPGLQQLLADVEAGKVDVIVVYKVDRLTRIPSIEAAAAHMGLSTQYFCALLRLGYLAPDIIDTILEGRQPVHLNRQFLARINI